MGKAFIMDVIKCL